MPTLLITGANRGLGLEFVKHYAGAGWRVHACARQPEAPELTAVAGDVRRHKLEATDWGGIAALAQSLRGEAIDLLLANAGIAGQAAGDLGTIDPDVWAQTFLTNALAPVKLAEAFVEHVASSKLRLMIAITSRLGSISLNDGGGRYAYNASKSALNMGWKSLSVDLKGRGITCVVLHPGWVSTDMGGAQAPVTPPQSVASMTKVIAGLKAADSGRFFNFDGEALTY
ncbi:SDR family oxidoreductase [Vineibacter terrae]|uniref:SDR family oxidoreductase n=1 Tax=Vineibacter terrae TaxID=2586908 RepID=A0A5C8P9H1_9HYPH|nr:SDR family oxidoreductase [Vineibacter terrae]TXL70413.1 SDR family oxidoreductase [Vineibacter terrae]